MKRIFISYGSGPFKLTLDRIGKEATKLNIFDSIILYTDNDLPAIIKYSPLMNYDTGGGYWIWKPYIIWKTIQNFNSNDIIVYADAGCRLHESLEWFRYFEYLENYNTILFQYKDNVDYGWDEIYGCSSPKIKHWTKKTTLNYFDTMFRSKDWRDYNKLMAGLILCKGSQNELIANWLDISLLHPHLIMDPFGVEIENQESYFFKHRHDQNILTPLGYYYNKKDSVLILPEESEHKNAKSIATTERLIIKEIPKISLKTKTISLIKSIIGEGLYNFLHLRL